MVICGFGRSGQHLGKMLEQEGITYVALDLDPDLVRQAAAAGESVVYGDAARRETLVAAGISRASAVAITYADTPSALKILHHVRELKPDIPVIVRTQDDHDLDKLIAAGATEVVPEVLEGSLMLGSHALVLLGVPLSRVVKRVRRAARPALSAAARLFPQHGRRRRCRGGRARATALGAAARRCGRRRADARRTRPAAAGRRGDRGAPARASAAPTRVRRCGCRWATSSCCAECPTRSTSPSGGCWRHDVRRREFLVGGAASLFPAVRRARSARRLVVGTAGGRCRDPAASCADRAWRRRSAGIPDRRLLDAAQPVRRRSAAGAPDRRRAGRTVRAHRPGAVEPVVPLPRDGAPGVSGQPGRTVSRAELLLRRPLGEPRQTREAVARIAAISPPSNVVFVTHHVNILALAGEAVGSGEAVLVRPAATPVRALGRLVL